MIPMVIAVVAATVSAASYGLSGALQHRVDREAPERDTMDLRVILDVIHRPMWLASLIAVLVAVAGQALALATAPLVLVQPILVSGVVFGAVFAALLQRQRPDRLVLLGALGAMGGLSAFLLLARPSQRTGTQVLPSVGVAWPLTVVFAALVGGCLALALRPPTPQTRTLALALASGVLYGLNAGLAKLALGQLTTSGFVGMLTSWPLWAIAVVGPAGFVLNQQAFATGVAASPAMAVITVTDPLVALGIGVVWLHESIRYSGGRLAGEIAAILVVMAAVAVLARRAPQAAQSEEDHRGPAGSDAPSESPA